ncbi:PREDICTED: uncharacterized protein LOC105460978 [Wasmannia auropunctata]|uniref:uncharacterized protein LOC105460978 n=1 Tax=Wasmannia auropunctata TaxID=64793 RepID=UPI0005EE3B8C|nr:PREDICTED: uncharacterized protein LOC105460978 [Wasmannia auropunctata]
MWSSIILHKHEILSDEGCVSHLQYSLQIVLLYDDKLVLVYLENREINEIQLKQLLALIEDGRSRRYVAEALDLSVSTVQRAYAKYLETNSFQRRPLERPQCTNNNDDRFIVLNSLRDRHRTAVQIRNNLRDVRNTNVSVDTVQRRLADQNLFSRKPAAVPLLQRRHRIARLNFAVEHRGWTHAD